jgi:pyruvate dehydrogenase E2 component (dihydrolipoyllysine-residue acetyltransferase)
MATLVEMPKLTDTMEEGVLRKWLVKEGDAVEPGKIIAEVETDKATMEMEAYDRGTILKLLIGEGQGVPPGAGIAILGKAGEDISAIEAKAASGGGHAKTKTAAKRTAPAPVAEDAPSAPKREGRIAASPLVRRLARENGIDLGGVSGSGPGGRIIKRDIEPHMGAAPAGKAATVVPIRPATLPPQPTPGDTLIPLTPMRKTIARRLLESKQTVPHYYLEIEVDADPLVLFRSQANRDVGDAGTKLSVNDIVLKAVARGLREVPAVNASWRDDGILRHCRVDLSVAVAIEDGLVTPVVRDADKKPIGEIAAEVRDLAERARARKLRPEEMQNGTFSVSNLGMFGIERFAAVINPPEAGILAVGTVVAKPVVRGEVVLPGKTLVLTLSADHRVIDGAVGARFLQVLKDLLEHPMRLVL